MELYANNVKIPFDETLQLKLYNPMFNDIGDHSLPISLNSKIPSIKKVFGFAGEITADPVPVVRAKIKTDLLELDGYWHITESGKRIEAFYKGATGNFHSLVGDKLLSELNLGGITYPAGQHASPAEVLQHMDTKMNAVYPTDEYAAFCAYMPNAYGSDTISSLQLVNDVEHNGSGNPNFKVIFTGLTNDTVYLFAGTVIEYLFNEHGYRIGRNVFKENENLKRLVIFNTYNRKSSDAFDFTKLVPRIKCTDLIKAITNRFGIGFFINEKSRMVDILFFDNQITSTPVSLKTKFTSRPVVDNRRVSGLYFPLNAPDAWSDHDYSSTDNFFYNTVNKSRDIPLNGITSGNVYYVKADNTFYRVVYENSAYVLKRLCTKNFPYGSGQTVDQYSGIPAMYTYVKNIQWTEWIIDTDVHFDTDVDFVMPRCDLECIDTNSPNNNTFPLMFLFTRGIQESYIVPQPASTTTPTTLKYPLANNDIYDARGNSITNADMGLNWGESGGIIESLWSNRLIWEVDIKKIIKGELTSDDLHKLVDFSNVVRIENNNYIVNMLDIEITRNKVIINEAELFRV